MVYYPQSKGNTFMKLLTAAVFASVVFAAVAADDAIVSANATLKDGSTIKGEFLAPKITGSTAFIDDTPLLTDLQRQFYKTYLAARYEALFGA